MESSAELCSVRSRSRREPLAGTAPHVDCWLMLEVRGAWANKAIKNNKLPKFVNQWMDRQVEHFAARDQRARWFFIKQRAPAQPGRQLFVGREGILRGTRVADDRELVEIDLAALPELVGERHYFVCTNGQRDLCCAKFGMPVYRKLRDLQPERSWQVSHVGGHRFAPNIGVLPDRRMYGQVDEHDVEAFLNEVENGGATYLRGSTYLPPEVQALEVARADFGQWLESEANDSLESWRVRYRTQAGHERTAQVRREQTSDVILPSCGVAAEPMYRYIVED